MTICTVITCYYESGLQINVSKTRMKNRKVLHGAFSLCG